MGLPPLHPRSQSGARSPILARAVLALAVALGASACASIQEFTEAASYTLLPPEQEEQLGERVAAEFEKQVTLLDDPVVDEYVSDLGQQVVAQAQIPQGIDVNFHVVDDPETVNAVALPGGEIYVFSGLLEAVDSEAELMGVLAHETAHVAERHIASQLVTQFGLETLTGLALGSGEASQLAALAADLATQSSLMTFSREAEREADAFAVQYSAAAGWDPNGYVDFFEEMTAQEGPQIASFLSSHPAPAERAQNARALIAQMGEVPDRTGEQRHREIVAHLEGADTAIARRR